MVEILSISWIGAMLLRLASDYTGVKVICEKIQKWYPQAKYDGIWASACLLHLSYEEIKNFIFLAAEALNDDGVIYINERGDRYWI